MPQPPLPDANVEDEVTSLSRLHPKSHWRSPLSHEKSEDSSGVGNGDETDSRTCPDLHEEGGSGAINIGYMERADQALEQIRIRRGRRAGMESGGGCDQPTVTDAGIAGDLGRRSAQATEGAAADGERRHWMPKVDRGRQSAKEGSEIDGGSKPSPQRWRKRQQQKQQQKERSGTDVGGRKERFTRGCTSRKAPSDPPREATDGAKKKILTRNQRRIRGDTKDDKGNGRGTGGMLRSLSRRSRARNTHGAKDTVAHTRSEDIQPKTPLVTLGEDDDWKDEEQVRVEGGSISVVWSGLGEEHEEDVSRLTLDSLSQHARTVGSIEKVIALDQERTHRPSRTGDVLSTKNNSQKKIDSVVVSDPNESFLNDRASQILSQNFAMEHRIFLRAILQLLNERDQFAVEADVNDPHTIKSGILKKASHLVRGIWKSKYVEIRQGLFSYYDDSMGYSVGANGIGGGSLDPIDASNRIGGDSGREGTIEGFVNAGGFASGSSEMQRKSIFLRANTCTCRPVKVKHKALNPEGAIFELIIEGGPRRLWMANSREERQAWIHAIHEAMIGRSVTRGDNFLDYQSERNIGRGRNGNKKAVIPLRTPFRADLELYLSIQAQVKKAQTREAYLAAFLKLVCRAKNDKVIDKGDGSGDSGHVIFRPLKVPVQWIKEQAEVFSAVHAKKAFLEESVAGGVIQLWKDMQRDSVCINGNLYKGDAGHGLERIVGALTRSIMQHDCTASQNINATAAFRRKFGITEAQALKYARDVLLACNRTRSGGDSYYCVENLCSNQELAVLCPSTSKAEPLQILVHHASPDEEHDPRSAEGGLAHSANDISGWITTRSNSLKKWKTRFGVLSNGVLSYYEEALPCPNKLRGKVLVSGANINVSQISVSNKNEEDDAGEGELVDSKSKTASTLLDLHVVSESSVQYIICINTKDSHGQTKKQQLQFDNQTQFFRWNQAFQGITCQLIPSHAQRATSAVSSQPQTLVSSPSADVDSGAPTAWSEGQWDPIQARIDSSDAVSSSGTIGGAGSTLASRLREKVRSVGGVGLRETSFENSSTTVARTPPEYTVRNDAEAISVSNNSVAAIGTANNQSGHSAPFEQSNLSSLQKKGTGTLNKVSEGGGKSTVEVSVRATGVYKICTTDPQGNETEDTWAMIQTNFLQNFRLSGGPNGRIMRGEEIVQIKFMEGLVSDDAFERAFTMPSLEKIDDP